MRMYVDPKLLDVEGALRVLPALPLAPTMLAPAGTVEGLA